MKNILFFPALLCCTIASSQEFQKTTPISADKRLTVKAGKRVDTSRFQPAVVHNFRQREEDDEVENEFRPPWRDITAEPNNLKIGTSASGTTSHRGTAWPAMTANGWVPPDPSLAVGPSDVVVAVNSNVAFYTKAGAVTFEQPLYNFFPGYGYSENTLLFDPKVFYDRLARRFVLVCLERNIAPDISNLLIAVSDDSSASGVWTTYRMDVSYNNGTANYWFDYPGAGYNKDAYFFAGNLFKFSNNTYGFGRLLVVPKAPLLAAAPANASYLLVPNAFTMQPAQTYDAGLDREYMAEDLDTSHGRVHVVTNVLTNPTLTSTPVTVPSFVYPSVYANSTAGRRLAPSDGRALNCMWRDGKLVYAHTVTGILSTVNKTHWYEVDTNDFPLAPPSLAQAGELGGGAEDCFMPAICRNGFGDIAVSFTRSSPTVVADAMMAVRRQSDAPGSLGTPTLLERSAGDLYGIYGNNRWGDYFDMTIDPVDDATFWAISMDGAADGRWRTSVFNWTVTPPATVVGLSINPSSAPSGATAAATVTLTGPAPSLGLEVSLTSANPTLASVPSTVTVAPGESSASFTIAAGQTLSDQNVTLTASNGQAAQASILILAPRLRGIVTLGQFPVSASGTHVRVEVRVPGTTTVLDSYDATLDGQGGFQVVTSRIGVFDVAVKGNHWLRKTVSSVTFDNSGASVSAALINGDIDRDNRITMNDWAEFRAAFTSTPGSPNWNPNADLNGDGVVDKNDLMIVRAHMYQQGDQ